MRLDRPTELPQFWVTSLTPQRPAPGRGAPAAAQKKKHKAYELLGASFGDTTAKWAAWTVDARGRLVGMPSTAAAYAGPVQSLSLTADGSALAAGGSAKMLELWRFDSMRKVGVWQWTSIHTHIRAWNCTPSCISVCKRMRMRRVALAF